MEQDQTTLPKKDIPPIDRATLSKESGDKLKQWLDVLHTRLKGVRLTKSDLVNWLVGAHSEQLTKAEQEQLQVQFYDDVKAHEWAIKEVREARARGEALTIEQALKGIGINVEAQSKPKKPRKPKAAIDDNVTELNLDIKTDDSASVDKVESV